MLHCLVVDYYFCKLCVHSVVSLPAVAVSCASCTWGGSRNSNTDMAAGTATHACVIVGVYQLVMVGVLQDTM
jgi:hypothetical protein